MSGVRIVWQALSLALLLAAWQSASLAAPAATLPPPAMVLAVLVKALGQGDLLHHLAATLARVAISFALALSLGSVIGMMLGRVAVLDRLFDFWVVFFLNLPALVTAILCFVWFGLGEGAALTAVALNKIPSVVVTLREGARTLDAGYGDLARIYRLGRWLTLRHVVLPQLAPYLMVAARSGLALIWKIVLVVELLGRSDGIGFKLHLFFQSFDVAGILAYSLAFILVIQAIELALLAPLERKAAHWRD